MNLASVICKSRVENLAPMTQATSHEELAIERLVATRKNRTPLTHLPEALRPASIEAAYMLQEALTTALDETPVG